jgi:membrane carboxypeptidase/penicillin-binding protein
MWVAQAEVDSVADEIRRILDSRLPFSPGLSEVMDAIVAAEDRRFWRHRGVDVIAMCRAAIHYLRSRRISGASTIEQQLVRTIRRRYEITVGRKVSEILISLQVSRTFSKLDIISAYLQVAYFGWMANGILQAIDRFDMDIGIPSEDDAVLLASLLKLPMPRHPSPQYLARLERRMNYVRAALRDAQGHTRQAPNLG